MGLLTRSGSRARPRRGRPGGDDLRPARADELVWLPGDVEVQVASGPSHDAAVRAAGKSATKNGRQARALRAVLAPDPGEPDDPTAVAVYVGGAHVGCLPATVARQAPAALIAFSEVGHARRLVSCPARIRFRDGGPRVVLSLDPGALRLPVDAFEVVPEVSATISRLLRWLDEPAPVLVGVDQQARSALAQAEAHLAELEAAGGEASEWGRAEGEFRAVATPLARAGDPMAARAWLGLGRAARYQQGRRGSAPVAVVRALHFRRAHAEAWWELVDLASAAPRVPTLLAAFARVPGEARASVLTHLLEISHGRDRMGRLRRAEGERLRAELLELADADGDTRTVAILAGLAGLAAEEAGNIGGAVRLWQRAVAAGSTDARVADKCSIWLVKQNQHEEAARVICQALLSDPDSPELARRMRRRLAYCEGHLAGHANPVPDLDAYQGRHGPQRVRGRT